MWFMKDEGMQMINSFVSRGQTIVSKMERKQPNNFNFIKRHGSYQMRHWFVYEKRDAMDCVRSESRDVCVICSTSFGCTVMWESGWLRDCGSSWGRNSREIRGRNGNGGDGAGFIYCLPLLSHRWGK